MPSQPGFSTSVRAGGQRRLLCLLLAALCIGIYHPSAHFGFVDFDDGSYVRDNPRVATGLTFGNILWAATRSHSSNWHPLTWISHMADVELFGLNAGGHHLTNIVLHATNGVLLFLALCAMTGSLWKPWFVAAAFVAHPLNVESAAWISERKNLLALFFMLLALLLYARSVKHRRRSWTPAVAIASFFALGLMSKPMIVTFPFALLLLDLWPLGRLHIGNGRLQAPVAGPGVAIPSRSGIGRLLLEKTALFVLAAASCVVTFFAQSKGDSIEPSRLLLRLAHAAVAYLHYLASTILPVNLSVFYPHPGMPGPGRVCIAVSVITGISILAIMALRRAPWFFVGWFWFLGTLVPMIGLIQVGDQAYADRYMYLPMTGLSIIVVWGIEAILRRFGLVRRTIAAGLGVAAIATFAIGSSLQLRYWRNSYTLFRRALRVTKNNYLAHNNLGAAFYAERQFDSAKTHFRAALAIRPAHAIACRNLGLALASQDSIKPALALFLKAIQLRPSFVDAYHSAGLACENLGQLSEAKHYYRCALSLAPDAWQASAGLGSVLLSQDSVQECIALLLAALAVNADNWLAHNQLSVAFLRLKDHERSASHAREAARLNTEAWEPWNNLGRALLEQGRFLAAQRAFSEAIVRSPGSATPYVNRAICMRALGELDFAKADLRSALRLEPSAQAARLLLLAIDSARGLAIVGSAAQP